MLCERAAKTIYRRDARQTGRARNEEFAAGSEAFNRKSRWNRQAESVLACVSYEIENRSAGWTGRLSDQSRGCYACTRYDAFTAFEVERLVTTLSMRRYSSASSADMNLSRSVSFSICSIERPV